MQLETIERLTTRSDRGRFLAKAGAGALALFAGRMAGQTAEAEAIVHIHGCNLCHHPDNGCPGNIACFWCWWSPCHYNVTPGACHKTQCCEGYKSGYACDASCDGVVCSAFGGQTPCGGNPPSCPHVNNV